MNQLYTTETVTMDSDDDIDLEMLWIQYESTFEQDCSKNHVFQGCIQCLKLLSFDELKRYKPFPPNGWHNFSTEAADHKWNPQLSRYAWSCLEQYCVNLIKIPQVEAASSIPISNGILRTVLEPTLHTSYKDILKTMGFDILPNEWVLVEKPAVRELIELGFFCLLCQALCHVMSMVVQKLSSSIQSPSPGELILAVQKAPFLSYDSIIRVLDPSLPRPAPKTSTTYRAAASGAGATSKSGSAATYGGRDTYSGGLAGSARADIWSAAIKKEDKRSTACGPPEDRQSRRLYCVGCRKSHTEAACPRCKPSNATRVAEAKPYRYCTRCDLSYSESICPVCLRSTTKPLASPEPSRMRDSRPTPRKAYCFTCRRDYSGVVCPNCSERKGTFSSVSTPLSTDRHFQTNYNNVNTFSMDKRPNNSVSSGASTICVSCKCKNLPSRKFCIGCRRNLYS